MAVFIDCVALKVFVAFVIDGAFVVLIIGDGVCGKLETTGWETVNRLFVDGFRVAVAFVIDGELVVLSILDDDTEKLEAIGTVDRLVVD